MDGEDPVDGLTRLAHLIVVLVVVVGPLVAWLLLLNRRDRREDRVHTALSPVLHAPDLDERLAVQVRCGVLSARCVARVYFSALSGGELWAFGTRLARIVPRHVRLVLDGTIDARAPASVRAEVVDVATLPGAPRAPLPWRVFSLRPVLGLHLEARFGCQSFARPLPSTGGRASGHGALIPAVPRLP